MGEPKGDTMNHSPLDDGDDEEESGRTVPPTPHKEAAGALATPTSDSEEEEEPAPLFDHTPFLLPPRQRRKPERYGECVAHRLLDVKGGEYCCNLT